MSYVGALASGAISSGIVRVIALWALHPREDQPAEANEVGVQFDSDPGPVVRDRRAVLMSFAERYRLRHAAHHQLVYLGVRPDMQRRGIGTSLLISHHALLHVTGTPSYVLADDIRTRDMFLRHGYSGIGPGRMLPGGLPVWPMWRPPGPADPS
jgi:GNAT superfamily N-acetyltransferase